MHSHCAFAFSRIFFFFYNADFGLTFLFLFFFYVESCAMLEFSYPVWLNCISPNFLKLSARRLIICALIGCVFDNHSKRKVKYLFTFFFSADTGNLEICAYLSSFSADSSWSRVPLHDMCGSLFMVCWNHFLGVFNSHA